MPFLWDEIIASASFHLLGQQTRPCFHPSAKECTGEAHSEAHSSPAGKMAANSTVAVVYSGHLGVVVPEAGALARRFLVDPLRASVFVAGQHAASVTGGSEPQPSPAPGYRLCGRPARGETKVAQPSANWRSGGYSQRQLTPRPASSSAQPRPVSCLGRARRPHRASSQYRHEAGEVVDSRTLWGRLLC